MATLCFLYMCLQLSWQSIRLLIGESWVRIPSGTPVTVTQLVEQWTHIPQVSSSNLLCDTIICICNSIWQSSRLLIRRLRVQVPPDAPYGTVAQQVERWTENPEVTSSTLVCSTICPDSSMERIGNYEFSDKGSIPFRGAICICNSIGRVANS